MVADQQEAFFCQGRGAPRVPSGPHSATRTNSPKKLAADPTTETWKEELDLLVLLD